MKPSLQELKAVLESFSCENWGTVSGRSICAQICQLADDDYDGLFRLYNEVVCLM